MELANVPVEGWIFEQDVHDLHCSPCGHVCFPAHYGDVSYIDVMTSDVGRDIDEGALRFSFNLSP